MKKNKICIEHEVNSSSPNIIWNLISTEGGMGLWLADEVGIDNDTLVFIWGEAWQQQEIRKATIIEKQKNNLIRMKWQDDSDPEAFMEIKMVRNELTGSYALEIIDFAEPGEEDDMRGILEDNFTKLLHSSGL
jgi:hypothetical protein